MKESGFKIHSTINIPKLAAKVHGHFQWVCFDSPSLTRRTIGVLEVPRNARLPSFHPVLIKFWPSSRIVVALACTCSIKNCSKSQSAWPVGTRYFQLGLITRHLRERKGFNGGDAIHTVTSPYLPANFGLTNLTVRIVQLHHECLLRISEGSKPKLLNYYWNIIRPPEFYALLNQCCVINLRVRVSCVSLWTVTRVMLQGARRGSRELLC